jgi:hypothetical protein
MAIWYIFIALWYIWWSFDIFSPFWYFVLRKIWQPCCLGGTILVLRTGKCYIAIIN